MNRILDACSTAIAALSLSLLIAPGFVLAAPVVLDSAWVVAPFATVPAVSPEGLSLDSAGRLYVCAGSAGVFRFDTTGSGSLWSQAVGFGQATLPNGETFVPSRDLFAPNHYIWRVAPDGTYGPLVTASPGEGWTWAATTPSGNLYSVIFGGAGIGIYHVDTNTGITNPVLSGGPGPGGAGAYSGLTTDDETVVVCGSDGPGFGVYSLSAGSLALIAPTPQLVRGICVGPDAIYGASGNAAGGQVWRVAGGSATLFANGFGNTQSVLFDFSRDRFYVLDASPAKIWVISRAPTPTRSVSIGRIHQLYR